MKNKVKVEREYWSNGKIKSEISKIDGLRQGIQKWWYDNGQIGTEFFTLDNSLHGIDQDWKKDGCRTYIMTLKIDNPNGSKIIFNYEER